MSVAWPSCSPEARGRRSSLRGSRCSTTTSASSTARGTALLRHLRTASAEVAAAALVAATTLGACGSDRRSSGPAPVARGPATVDERAGTYRGVGIGSTRDEARRELGRLASGATDPLAPIGADGLDVGVPPSPRHPHDSGGIAIWRFKDAVMAAGRGRAWLVTVAAHDAVTGEGVGVGSALDDVRAAYPAAECDTANEGTEYTQFEYCTLRVAPERHLWFAYDPVRSVTMSREPPLR